jgi:hypothetical protein
MLVLAESWYMKKLPAISMQDRNFHPRVGPNNLPSRLSQRSRPFVMNPCYSWSRLQSESSIDSSFSARGRPNPEFALSFPSSYLSKCFAMMIF